MTKISGISDTPSQIPLQKRINPQGDLFKDTLTRALDKTPVSAGQKSGGSALGEIQTVSFNKVEDATLDMEERTRRLLDQLDAYANELENPRKTLKQIAPLIVAIKDGAAQLMKDAHEAGPKSRELKEIATQCAITANVEYIKFIRGDYT